VALVAPREQPSPPAAATPNPPLPPVSPTAPQKTEDKVLKVSLPDIFAFRDDQTMVKMSRRFRNSLPGVDGVEEPGALRGNILLVESDAEVCRLISRLLHHEGYSVVKASCLAEARAIVKEQTVDYLMARRVCVPVNVQTETALREIEGHTTIRIIDNFTELMLGQVVDYQSLSSCLLSTMDLLMSLLEGANIGARGHAHNVAKYCRLVGQRLGMPRRELDALTLAAFLHDIGPLETLHSIGAISLHRSELAAPDLRPTLEILSNVPFAYPVLEVLADACTVQTGQDQHDPATATPIAAHILRVVDTYDTLRRTKTEQQDEELLFDAMRRQPAGTFDAEVLETFINLRKNERVISAMNLVWAAVLLVDPHPEELQLLKLRLENEDFHILTASTIEEALHLLRSENVTVILSERDFDGENKGLELLRSIKEDPGLRHIPFIFHAAGNNDMIKDALEQGAEDWFPKPYNVEIMAMKLNRVVARMRADPSSRADGVTGALSDMGIIEMVQIFSAGMRSVQIFLECGAHNAELCIHRGQIVTAQTGELTAEQAAMEILTWTEGRFRILPLRQPPTPTITSSTDSLLLNSCVKRDHDRAR
jgi:response regulator RpfG family c-di-GMP phosphodiesterase